MSKSDLIILWSQRHVSVISNLTSQLSFVVARWHLLCKLSGIRGVMMAALLSALISSMTSIFNSSSTVFTMDLWRRCRPQASEREKMVVSRLWILFLIVVSIVWLPVLQIVKGSQFWTYTQSTWSFFVPPIVMTFLFGIFWPRTTEQVSAL